VQITPAELIELIGRLEVCAPNKSEPPPPESPSALTITPEKMAANLGDKAKDKLLYLLNQGAISPKKCKLPPDDELEKPTPVDAGKIAAYELLDSEPPVHGTGLTPIGLAVARILLREHQSAD
jgi:hypothetical protein